MAEPGPGGERRGPAARTATPSLAALSFPAPAKVNLYLHVTGRRADGYHELDSLIAFAGVGDTVTVWPADDLSLAVDGPFADRLPPAPDNLVLRAARRLARAAGVEAAAAITLTKRLPVASGLGGGSADAAATLRLCNHLWGAGLSDDRLAELGSSLGSDVPLFFHLPAALMEGRGERVREFSLAWSGWALLINTGSLVSTPEVYQAHRVHRANQRRAAQPEEMQQLATASSAEELMSLTRNDLEPAIFAVAPDVANQAAFQG